MTLERPYVDRTYNAPLYAAGDLPRGHPDRERVVDSLAAAIFVEWNVRNLLVWENVRRPHVRHWRDDCPALRRAAHAKSRLIPKEDVATGRNCGTCIRLDDRDRAREAKRQRDTILTLEPPKFAELPRAPIALLTQGEPNCANGGTTCADCPGNCWNEALGCSC